MSEPGNDETYDPYAFELLVGNLLAGLLVHQRSAPIQIHHRKRYPGRRSGHEHEIDLSFTTYVAGAEILILIECKAYRRAVGVGDVLTFAERIDDIGAHKGLIVTLHGFQKGAAKVARGRGIALLLARPHERRLIFEQRFIQDPEDVRRQQMTIESMALAVGLPEEPLGTECQRIWHETLESLSFRSMRPKLPDVQPLQFAIPNAPRLLDAMEFGALLVAVAIVEARTQHNESMAG